MSISYPRPFSNVVLLPCRTQLLELYSTLARTAVARRLKQSRATAVWHFKPCRATRQ